MKKLSLILTIALILGMLAGCAGTPVVYYTNCTCPAAEAEAPAATEAPAAEAPAATEAPVASAGSVKTGLYIGTSVGESKSATAEEPGEAAYDVTVVAVLVDDNGIIVDCVIDSLGTSVAFGADGVITADLTAPVQTKNQLGENYGMVAWGGAIAEWDAQAAALAEYAKGKTVDQLKTMGISESGYAADADLASSATIYLGGYVAAIEQAVASAQHLGAQTGCDLRLAVIPGVGSSASADAENAGNAQLDMDVAAVSMQNGVITSCIIDSLQAKVAFGADGVITTDVTAPVLTKNGLGENYGMVAWGGAIAEWNEQAASFAAYVTGKTPAEVAGIAVNEGTKPAEADLATSVTIAIGGFQALIAEATK